MTFRHFVGFKAKQIQKWIFVVQLFRLFALVIFCSFHLYILLPLMFLSLPCFVSILSSQVKSGLCV